MKVGDPGDSLSLVRVILAMLACAILLGIVGTGFDRVVGPSIGMDGWWTVFATGGFILGGMLQAAREFSVPQSAERRALAAEARAHEEAARAGAGSAEPPDA